MPERITKSRHEYPLGQWREPGEKFHVEPEHVDLLETLGRIEKEEVGTHDAVTAEAPDDVGPLPTGKRRYVRRDRV